MAIDLAPTPAKEFVVRTLGTYDKPVLVAAIGLVLAVVAGLLGLLAWRHRVLALVGIGALGLVGAAATVYRLGWTARVPLARVGRGRSGRAGLAHPEARGRASSRGRSPLTPPRTAAGRRRGRSRRRRLREQPACCSSGPADRLVGSSPCPPRVRRPRRCPAGAQIPGMTPFSTPAADFYRVDISLITPRIETEGWTLTIDGSVDRPLTLSYEDLLALPMIERDITLTCVSNEVGGPYVSSARWLGVPFAEIIKRVGVRPGVDQVFSYSLDSGYTCSTPYQAVSDGRDAMIVVGMNGQPLPDERGFPARMLVPGLFGFVSATKWLKRIEFTTYATRTRVLDAAQVGHRRADPHRRAASTSPSPWARCHAAHRCSPAWPGRSTAASTRWRSGSTTDRGRTPRWPPTPASTCGGSGRSVTTDRPDGTRAQVRATDRSGAVQPESRTRVFPSGATGWHQIQFVRRVGVGGFARVVTPD